MKSFMSRWIPRTKLTQRIRIKIRTRIKTRIKTKIKMRIKTRSNGLPYQNVVDLLVRGKEGEEAEVEEGLKEEAEVKEKANGF
jgi:hypothetical protein